MSIPTCTPTRPALDGAPQPGDHDRFAHYADRDLIVEALVFGLELEALCGKRWVPSADPSRFPICPTCREALLQLALDG